MNNPFYPIPTIQPEINNISAEEPVNFWETDYFDVETQGKNNNKLVHNYRIIARCFVEITWK